MEPTGEQNTMSPAPQGDKSIGPAIGVIIIILVVLLGGLYFWSQQSSTQNPAYNVQDDGASAQVQAEIDMLQSQSSSDDLDSIEADLSSSDFSNLGSELDSIEAESSGGAQVE